MIANQNQNYIKSGNIGIIHLSYLPLCSLRSSKVKSFRCSRKRYYTQGSEIHLASVDFRTSMDAIYEDVIFTNEDIVLN
ncbi:hypothetical protein [Microcoleus sp. CAWBG640]|uniref:hypothetical protein n=1 Tax=Microcoleus sp. CAWBG640 TaxID=2841653 RepID=UPI00312BA878